MKETDDMLKDLLTADVSSLLPFLDTIIQDGGKKTHALSEEVKTFRQNMGYSGYEYVGDDFSGQLSFGIILGGTGFVLKRTLTESDLQSQRFDYFNIQGEVTFTADQEALKPLLLDPLEMDVTCPILDHFYNFLYFEYKEAEEGKSRTELVFTVEKNLKRLYKSKELRLPIQDRTRDPAVTNVYMKMLKTEMDPVLTWEERQLVFKNYRDNLKKIMKTKTRAHKMSSVFMGLSLFMRSLSNFLVRFISRPINNFLGILHRYTIGKVIWFCQTVKNNLGYSVALAVYGPFTYYFITMPMNPHAMQAVGKVRSTYLEAKHQIAAIIDQGEIVINDMSSKEAIAEDKTPATQPVIRDEVSTSVAAPSPKAEKSAKNEAKNLSHIIYQSEVTAKKTEPLMLYMGSSKKEEYSPSFMNILLSPDVEKVNKQPWLERMSNFKQMQIAYEENIEYASRMGRLEQLETQYNFPMQVENTWEELERYSNKIFKYRQENPNLSAKMKQYLFNEVERTQQLQLYLWDRMGRFILDQIYVMLDQDNEQKRSDYYVGRSFVFMQEMTDILSWRYKDFKKPEGYERIEKLAKFYSNNRKEYGSVMKNLKENSDLFQQKDIYNTAEFRSYMKRQWEILFLQNAKAEEASNMGLNMYIWSVRNTAWVLQSMYSAKSEELAMLIKRDTTGSLFTPDEMQARSKISMLYETLFHNLTLEYVGIREELKNRLSKDIEGEQRMIVINNLKEFLTDREKLDGPGLAKLEKNKSEAEL